MHPMDALNKWNEEAPSSTPSLGKWRIPLRYYLENMNEIRLKEFQYLEDVIRIFMQTKLYNTFKKGCTPKSLDFAEKSEKWKSREGTRPPILFCAQTRCLGENMQFPRKPDFHFSKSRRRNSGERYLICIFFHVSFLHSETCCTTSFFRNNDGSWKLRDAQTKLEQHVGGSNSIWRNPNYANAFATMLTSAEETDRRSNLKLRS